MVEAIASTLLGILPQVASIVIPKLVEGAMNSTSSSATNQQSQSQSVSNSTTQGYQQGSVNGIASLLNTALSTPTTNNSQSAANFNLQSAQTANNLQSAQWTSANILNLISNIMANAGNAVSQTSARAYNSQEAALARDWQAAMRKTAYQDTVADLKAAGLNPILAAMNGASATPSTHAGSIAAQGYNQVSAASIPSAKTASMQAMYDYGNNTAQYVNNALQTINNAKQMNYSNVASSLEQSMNQIVESSAKQISEEARTEKYSLSMGEKKASGFGGMGGGSSRGGGGGRGR